MTLPTLPAATGRWPRRALLLSGLTAALAFSDRPAADDNEVLRRLVLGVQQFYDTARPESAYLHLDKDVYTAGETVWLRAYVTDAAQHQLDTLSKVLHVELLSDRQIAVSRRSLALRGGLADGDLVLPDTLAPGTYLLRAYTGWMRNAGPEFFYQRRLQVWPAAGAPSAGPAARAAAPPDVQFFPEGGNLVAGLSNVVAFKAVDGAGRSLAVAGQVLDGQGQPVATFASRHAGMGTFQLTPAAGQTYRAVVSGATGSTPMAPLAVPLPAVQASGYVLHVADTPEAFNVSIGQSGGSGGAVLLLGQVGRTVGYLGRGQVQGAELFSARISKSKFPSGIVHFTLFDGQGHALAERLAFALNEAPLRITLSPDRPSYGPRQPVRVQVAVADAAGRPVATELSVAVADADASRAEAAENIASRLLLTADLAGYVEDPGYYFQAPGPAPNPALDDLLLTQGWRRFAWEAVLAGPPPAPEFGLERNLGLLGQVLRPDGKPAAKSSISFLQTKPTKQFVAGTTDAEGRFLFNGLSGCDTVKATLQARSERGKRNVRIVPDPGPPPARPAWPLPPLPAAPPAGLAAAVQRGQAQQLADHEFQLVNDKSILLGNVAVQAQRAAVADPRRLYPSGNATVVRLDDIASAKTGGLTVLQALQGRLPGVVISGSEPNMSISMRGQRSFSGDNLPLIVLDGVPTTIDALSFYQAADVETVEILRPGQATIYGTAGVNGVVAVFTRRGSPTYDRRQEQVPGVLAVRLPGYQCPRQFYVPRYGAGAPAPARPDNRRSTLYWNPRLRTDAAGQAELTFPTSAALGRFRLMAEGISTAGQPALGSGTLEVR